VTSTTYHVLFQVVIRHAYFADGHPRELLVQPTPATTERLRRLGCYYKPLPDGFVVLGTLPARMGVGLAAVLNAAPPLLFSLVPCDPHFFTYTNARRAPGYLCLYRLGALPARTARRRVAMGPVLPLRSLTFAQPIAPALVPRMAQLQSLSGKALPSQLVRALATSLPLDLGSCGSGIYCWQLGTESFRFYADDYLMATQPWAAFEVSAAVLMAPAGAVYTLEFAVRPPYRPHQRKVGPPQPAGTATRAHVATAVSTPRVALPDYRRIGAVS
jgi:hypothetical protein